MLTPQDVRSVQFEKNLRGYRTEDVDRFLDKIEEQLQQDDAQAEQLRKQIADLTAENQRLHRELQSYEADGDMLKSALINAQRMGESVIREANQKAEETDAPAGAMMLPDGRVITGKTSSLLGASAALLLNALKAMAGIRSDLDLISNQVIEPISALKIQSLGHHNPRLHSDEVLIALAISALTNPLADMARAQLGTLRGCDAHFSVIISEEDIKLYKRLGIHVSCEPKYESKRLYHK